MKEPRGGVGHVRLSKEGRCGGGGGTYFAKKGPEGGRVRAWALLQRWGLPCKCRFEELGALGVWGGAGRGDEY